MRPLRRDVGVPRRRAPGRLELVQGLDGEAAAAAAARSARRGPGGTRPTRRFHSKLRIPNWGSASVSPEGSSSSCMVRTTSGELVRNHSHPPGRSSRAASGIHASGSHHRLAPYSEIGDVEGVVGQRDGLGAALDEREVQAVLGLQRARSRKLLGCHIDAHGARSAARQPRRHVRGTAPELDDVAPIDLGERIDARLRDLPHAPGDLVVGPVAPSRGLVVLAWTPQASRLARAWSLRLTPTERRGPGGSSWGA